MRAERRRDSLGVAAGGDDRVPGRQGRLRDVHAHASTAPVTRNTFL